MDIYADLNEKQYEAVVHEGGPLLVLAGAGSGKTRVLTYRVAHLLQQGVPARNILAITFTNKAAREMRDRLQVLAPDMSRDLWVCTFHAACLRILRREIQHLHYDRNFVIYDENDQQTVIKDCLKELNLDPKKYPPRSFSWAISAQKNRLISPQEFGKQAAGHWEELVARVYLRYQERLEQNNALDFDDLLVLTVHLFDRFPEVLAYYRRRFQHILVDEYQDTNHAQYVLVNMLAQEHRNLTVVGDPDQSIYGWRGADISNILNFERDYPDAVVVKLEENYRSTNFILEAANNVIKHNAGRKEKRLWTARGDGEPLQVYYTEDEMSEARLVADMVRRMHEEGRPFRDFAVLYRTHAQSRVLEENFLRYGIPHIIVGGQRFYDRKEIKDVLAYLSVIVNPSDGVSLSRIINVPRRGIGKTSEQRFFAYAMEKVIPPALALQEAHKIPGLTKKVRSVLQELGDMLAEWRQSTMSVTGLTEEVLEKTGYWRELAADRSVEAQTRIENIREFFSVTKEFDTSRGGTLGEFLADLALYSDVDSLDEETDQVSLMTLHAAKGLEFPVVFLTGMEEGVFPHSRAFSEPAEMEEERRLCYVGITRAEEKLILTHCARRTLYGNSFYNQPSRFLSEIPEDLMVREGPQPPGVLLKQKPAGNRPASPGARGDAVSFSPGDKIRHSKWGEGTVVQVDGEGPDAQLKVAFPQQGVKTLLLQYAPIEKM